MKQIDKVKRYDWVRPGDNGIQCIVKINDLKIDHTYQRAEVSDRNTLAIARDFSWVAFNSIIVMQRNNGEKYIVDGQQRILAARKRGDIQEVPCVLFKSDGRKHEAEAFISLNIRRAPVPAVVKFNASVQVGIKPEKDICEWLSTQGLTVVNDGKNKNGVNFPTKLVNCWKINAEASMSAILIQREINGAEPLHSKVHEGFFWLLHNKIDVKTYIEKLKRAGGRTAILHSIKMFEIETGKNSTIRGCGIGVLRLINYKLRGSRIKIPE